MPKNPMADFGKSYKNFIKIKEDSSKIYFMLGDEAKKLYIIENLIGFVLYRSDFIATAAFLYKKIYFTEKIGSV